MDYANKKIYKIVCNITGKVYIGSTSKKYLSERLSGHRRHYNSYKLGKGNFTTSYDVLENNDYSIILLENYPCNDKNERNARERYYLETIECVNKNLPGRKSDEYFKQYAELNKDKITSYKAKYAEKNKDKIISYKAKYVDNNKEKIKERSSETIKCEICNNFVIRYNFPRHLKTKKHIDNCVEVAEQKVNV